MNTQEPLVVAGHGGTVGSATVRRLQARGHSNILAATHARLDLADQAAVRGFFAAH